MNIISDKYLSCQRCAAEVAVVDCARYPITKWPYPKRGYLAGNNATSRINPFKSADSRFPVIISRGMLRWIKESRNSSARKSKMHKSVKRIRILKSFQICRYPRDSLLKFKYSNTSMRKPSNYSKHLYYAIIGLFTIQCDNEIAIWARRSKSTVSPIAEMT